MAEGYNERQSVFIDGDVILAEHGNLEFNKLVSVFDESTGHNHDNTEGGGGYVPLLKDLTEAQDFTLTATGVTGTVILDEDDFISDSTEHLATQQSIKAFVEAQDAILSAVDVDLQAQIDVFDNSNHGHSNKDELDTFDQGDVDYLEAKQTIALKTTHFTASYNVIYNVTAAAPLDITLPTMEVGKDLTIYNTIGSAANITINNPSFTITGDVGTATAGVDIILEPGDIINLLALTATTMEVR